MPEAIPPHVAHITGRKLPHHFGGVRHSLMCQGGCGRYPLPPLSANFGMVSVVQPSIPQHRQVLEKLLLLTVANLPHFSELCIQSLCGCSCELSASSVLVPKDLFLQGGDKLL